MSTPLPRNDHPSPAFGKHEKQKNQRKMIERLAAFLLRGKLFVRFGAALLLGNGILERVALLFHLVSSVSTRPSRNQVPATRERRNQRESHAQPDYFFQSHCIPM